MFVAVNSTCIITGGNGSLAQSMEHLLSKKMSVLSPGREALDVCSQGSVDTYFKDKPSPELLICNAGVTQDGLLVKLSESAWDEVLNTNLTGVFRCTQAVARKMLKDRVSQRKHIIIVGSYSGVHPPAGQANYAAAKSALHGFTKSQAQELGSRNIRVNLIMPGWIEKTKLTRSVTESAREEALKKHCLSEFNTGTEVASFIDHLHFNMLYTSGQVFNLDSRILK